MQFELFANPYYNDSQDGLFSTPTFKLETQIDELTEKLKLTCKDNRQREGYFQKVHSSFRNVKVRWDNTLDAGTARLPGWDVKQLSMILDKHFGHFLN